MGINLCQDYDTEWCELDYEEEKYIQKQKYDKSKDKKYRPKIGVQRKLWVF